MGDRNRRGAALEDRRASTGRLRALSLALAVLWSLPVAATAEFDPGLAAVDVRVDGTEVPYRVLAFSLLPGESLSLSVRGAGEPDAAASEGSLRRAGHGVWRWTAPRSPGLATIRIGDGSGEVQLQVLVLRPADEIRRGELQGYQIGRYPPPAERKEPIYEPPRGFVEVTEDLVGTSVSPHFQLGQFLCKQEGGFPGYIVLRTELLLQLERILQHVNDEGFRAETLAIMSGFRTPAYNQSIGNVPYSRHLWGGAADIFVDVAPSDGRMDDLDGDGVVDERDAERLYRWVEALEPRPWYRRILGGLSSYRATAFHGPFVHVDVRGRRARW